MALALVTAADASRAAALPPPFYSAKDIRATVVNEETGGPLEGVVVVRCEQRELARQLECEANRARIERRPVEVEVEHGVAPRPQLLD